MGARASADEDARRYREGYPGLKDEEDPKRRYNQEFYENKRKSVPDGDYIDVIHDKWWGNYDLLEFHHGYIQWLFPIREPGMNFDCQPLTSYEASEMRENAACKERLQKSYCLILDFYGMQLDPATGKVSRCEKGWQARYQNLQMSAHNYLRITRILKCLGELGFQQFQAPWCDLFIKEVFVTQELSNCASSLVNYWIPVVKDDAERGRLECEVKRLAQPSASEFDER